MLSGQRVVVTRASHQASGLCAAFEAAGAEVVRLPLIELVPASDPRELARAAHDIRGYEWLVLTSTNAVEAFLPRVKSPRQSWPRIAAIGPATAAALQRFGAEPTLTATVSRAEGLLEVLSPHLRPGTRVLLPQAEDARPDLMLGLRAAGAVVTVVGAYRKRLPATAMIEGQQMFRHAIGWVTCTSPRIARHLAGLFSSDWSHRRGDLRAISIGPVTSAELRHLGVEPMAEARVPSEQGLVDATINAVAALRGGKGKPKRQLSEPEL